MKSILGLIVICFLTAAHADLTNGLVAYYPFSGNANDESGNARNGTVVGAHLTTDRFGNASNAYAFTNMGEYIVVHNSLHPQGYVDLTYSLWVTWPAPVSSVSLLNVATVGANGMFTSYSRSCVGFHNVGGPLIFYSHQSANDAWFYQWPTNFLVGEWHQIVVTKTGTTVRLYLDGNLNEQRSLGAALQNVTSTELFIGQNGTNTHLNGEQFLGKLDDIRIWNRVLTDQEIRELYARESGIPLLSIETAAVRLRWFAASNVTYEVQWSTNFQNWSNLVSILGGDAETNVLEWVTEPKRFYRLTIP